MNKTKILAVLLLGFVAFASFTTNSFACGASNSGSEIAAES